MVNDIEKLAYRTKPAITRIIAKLPLNKLSPYLRLKIELKSYKLKMLSHLTAGPLES